MRLIVWLGLLASAFVSPVAAGFFTGDLYLMGALASLNQGGNVIVFRHCATHQDQADTDPLNRDNVAKQCQLNDDGRKVAREVGAAMRKLQIAVAQVQTSLSDCAIETGTLLDVGPVTSTDDSAAAMRKLAATVPPTGTNMVLVSHKPNIVDAFGPELSDIKEGEAVVFRPDGNGYKVYLRFSPGFLTSTASNIRKIEH